MKPCDQKLADDFIPMIPKFRVEDIQRLYDIAERQKDTMDADTAELYAALKPHLERRMHEGRNHGACGTRS